MAKTTALIDALETRINQILLGQDVRKACYRGRSTKMGTGTTSLADLRARKAEFERRCRACGC